MEARTEDGKSFPLRHTSVDVSTDSSSSASGIRLEVSQPKTSVYSVCMKAIDLFNHMLIVGLTLFTLYHSLSSMTVFNLHATLCTVAYVLLMSEAIAVFAGDNVPTSFLSHRAKRHAHWILQLLGLICAVAGVAIMYRAKENHFRSIHAILGVASVAATLFLAALGYPVYAAAKLRKLIRPALIKFGHNLLGLGCFAIGMASQCYGYKKFRALNISSDVDVRLVCVAVVALITFLSVRRALPDLLRQFLLLFK